MLHKPVRFVLHNYLIVMSGIDNKTPVNISMQFVTITKALHTLVRRMVNTQKIATVQTLKVKLPG